MNAYAILIKCTNQLFQDPTPTIYKKCLFYKHPNETNSNSNSDVKNSA